MFNMFEVALCPSFDMQTVLCLYCCRQSHGRMPVLGLRWRSVHHLMCRLCVLCLCCRRSHGRMPVLCLRWCSVHHLTCRPCVLCLCCRRSHGGMHHAPPEGCAVLLQCSPGMEPQVACLLAGWMHWYCHLPMQVSSRLGGAAGHMNALQQQQHISRNDKQYCYLPCR